MTTPSPMVDALLDVMHGIGVATERDAQRGVLAVLDNLPVAAMARAHWEVSNDPWDGQSAELQKRMSDRMSAAIAAVRAEVGETKGR